MNSSRPTCYICGWSHERYGRGDFHYNPQTEQHVCEACRNGKRIFTANIQHNTWMAFNCYKCIKCHTCNLQTMVDACILRSPHNETYSGLVSQQVYERLQPSGEVVKGGMWRCGEIVKK